MNGSYIAWDNKLVLFRSKPPETSVESTSQYTADLIARTPEDIPQTIEADQEASCI